MLIDFSVAVLSVEYMQNRKRLRII